MKSTNDLKPRKKRTLLSKELLLALAMTALALMFFKLPDWLALNDNAPAATTNTTTGS